MALRMKLLAIVIPLWLLSIQIDGFSVSSTSIRPALSTGGVRSLSLLSASPDNGHHDTPVHIPIQQQLRKGFASAVTAVVLASGLLAPLPTLAIESQIIGQISGSGLVFKDTLEVERFEDPKIKGVTLYITNFQRPITERLTSNFFQDPSYASVACVKSSPTVAVADNINMTPQGEEVFQESKSLLFKTLRVQRIYDADKKTAIYVSFNTRLDKNDDTNKSRFKSSVCAVGLE